MGGGFYETLNSWSQVSLETSSEKPGELSAQLGDLRLQSQQTGWCPARKQSSGSQSRCRPSRFSSPCDSQLKRTFHLPSLWHALHPVVTVPW